MADTANPQAAIAADAPTQTAPTAAATQPTAVNPTPEAVLTSVFDVATLDSALFGAGSDAAAAQISEPAQVTPQTEAPAPVATEPPAGVNPPSTPPATEQVPAPAAAPENTPTETERILPNRISTAQFDAKEQQAIALRHELAQQGSHITLRQALERVEGLYNPSASEPVTAVPTPPAAPQTSALQALEAEVAALETQIQEAGEGMVLYGPEIAKLNTEFGRKAAQLEALKLQEAHAAQTAAANGAQAQQAVMAQVLQEYPTAGDDKSYLGARVAAIIADVHASPDTHPLRDLLAGTNAAAKVVEHAAREIAPRMAQDFGITEAQALAMLKPGSQPAVTPAPAGPAVPRPVPRTIGVTSPGQVAPPPAPPAPTAAQVLQASLLNPRLVEDALGFGASW